MTRIEEIEKASKEYRKCREECGVEDPILLDEVDDAHFMGALWADEHPAERKVFLESVCSWININVCKYHKSGVFHVDEFIMDLKKAMDNK